jgi:hypothetical protein
MTQLKTFFFFIFEFLCNYGLKNFQHIIIKKSEIDPFYYYFFSIFLIHLKESIFGITKQLMPNKMPIKRGVLETKVTYSYSRFKKNDTTSIRPPRH